MNVTMQKCNCCGENKKLTDYYSSSAYFMKHTGKVHTCKQCMWDFVDVNDPDVNFTKVRDTLRMLDKPFLYDLWSASTVEAENREGHVFKMYMKNIGMKQYRDLTYDDSQFEANSLSPSSKEIISPVTDAYAETVFDEDELKRLNQLWGKLSNADYTFLENFYGEYRNNFPTDTPAQVNIYKNLAKIHLQAEKELEKNNIRGYKDLIELSSKMHTDGNIKPIQSTGMNDDKGLSTYGLWIKQIEADEPCEYFENKPIYEDFDQLKKYFEKWFIRPFKNIFNISKDFDVGDD